MITSELLEQAAVNLAKANKRRPIVYLSGPITKGNRNHHLFAAWEAHEMLMKAGFSVINPMLNMQCPFNVPGAPWAMDHQTWLENDLPQMAAAQAVFRLPGESLGAEMECMWAKQCGVPIYTDMEELIRYRDNLFTIQIIMREELQDAQSY